MKKFLVLFFVLIIAVGLSLIGCEGKQGPAGVPGSNGNDGINANACTAPCHNTNGIWEQYGNSTHFIAILNADEQSAWLAGACGMCHAKDGLESRLDGTVGGGTPTHLLQGQTRYLSGTTKEAVYNGSSGETANFAQVTCLTCHEFVGQGPHSDSLYTGNKWALRAPATGVYLEKSSAVLTSDGTLLNYGVGNTCVWCHKSRQDVTDYIKVANPGLTSFYWGPHEGPGADLYSGTGGYQFTGKTYGNSAHIAALTEGCIECHMAPVATNGNFPRHDFKPAISATCLTCHVGATSIGDIFTANTVDEDVKTLLDSLQNRFTRFTPTGAGAAVGLLTRTSNSTFLNDLLANSSDPVLTAAENTDGQYWLDRTRTQRTPSFNSVTGTYTSASISLSVAKDVAGALYDYFLVSRSKGYGAHNSVYARQLLYDANEVVGTALGMGTPLSGLPTRP
jgi:hypothetical protein